MKLLQLILLISIAASAVAQGQDADCGNNIIEVHGKSIIFLQQLRPVVVHRLRHLAVEICGETSGNFYVQVWRNETTGTVPEFKLIWQYLVQRDDPKQALFTIPELLQLDLSGLIPAHRERLFFGVTAPNNNTFNPTGQIPVRSYFSLNSQALVSKRNDDAGHFFLGETREFTELFYPYFFVLSLCEDGDVTKCELPIAPERPIPTCGIPGSVVSNVSEVAFRGRVRAVMVNFCAINASVEIVLIARDRVQRGNETTYSAVWSEEVIQSGSLYHPTVLNLTTGPTIHGPDHHLVVKTTTTYVGGSTDYIPVKPIFDPITTHTRTHRAVPKTLGGALYYPYFLPVTLCKNSGCENPIEEWAQTAMGVKKPTNTTPTPSLSVDPGKVTVIEWPPLPGAPGTQGQPGPQGVRGPKGDSGDIGPGGLVGPDGALGAPGFRGPKGDVGFTGLTGEAAVEGAPGPPGPPGMRGEQGDVGLSGLRGDPGMRIVDNSKSPAVGAASTGACECSPLLNSLIVLGIIIWAVLLTLLVLVLMIVASRSVSRSDAKFNASFHSIR